MNTSNMQEVEDEFNEERVSGKDGFKNILF
jgi:hypothetical protein